MANIIQKPCQVGDTVYFINCGEIYEAEVIHLEYFESSRTKYWSVRCIYTDEWSNTIFDISGWNVNVYATRKEAEENLNKERRI